MEKQKRTEKVVETPQRNLPDMVLKAVAAIAVLYLLSLAIEQVYTTELYHTIVNHLQCVFRDHIYNGVEHAVKTIQCGLAV